jgi:phosphomannomutase
MGSHILHPVGRSGGHIHACPYSLVASRIHNRLRQAFARHPNSCVGDSGRATSYMIKIAVKKIVAAMGYEIRQAVKIDL